MRQQSDSEHGGEVALVAFFSFSPLFKAPSEVCASDRQRETLGLWGSKEQEAKKHTATSRTHGCMYSDDPMYTIPSPPKLTILLGCLVLCIQVQH